MNTPQHQNKAPRTGLEHLGWWLLVTLPGVIIAAPELGVAAAAQALAGLALVGKYPKGPELAS